MGARVLFLTSNFPRWPGDSTTPFVLHLAADLRDRGFDVHVLAPHAPGAAREEQIDGVPVRRFRYLLPESAQTVCYGGGALINLRRQRSNLAKLPALLAAEWAATRRELRHAERGRTEPRRTALLHSHWVLPQGFVGRLAAGRRIPHVITVHGGDVFGLQGRAMAAAKKFAFATASAVTVNGPAAGQAAQKLGVAAPRVIPMGVDVAATADQHEVDRLRHSYRRNGGPLLVFVGRLVAEKGITDVVDALAQLPDTATALFVGDGQERALAEQHATKHGVRDRVHFAGWVDPTRVPDYLAAADVVVAPSRIGPDGWTEAQGLAIVEAMAAARPVVATRVGGIPDVIVDGESGLLVTHHSPAELAAAITRLTDDPALALRLATSAQQRARARFSRQATADAFASLYDELLR